MGAEIFIDANDTVLITGGTGFTGAHLVRAVCATGATVRIIARASSNREQFSDLPIDWFTGDVFDESLINQAMAGANIIFQVAAAYREAKIADDVYRKVHVQSTVLLANAALRQPAFKWFVHISTVGVHGHIAEPPADEHYRFSPGDLYQSTKMEAELWIHEFALKNDLPMTVIRPTAIYGPGDRRLLKIFKMAKVPICPVLGFGCKGLYHLIHVTDLVNFMMHVVGRKQTAGEVYICGANEPISIKGMIKYISTHLNTHPIFLRIPVTPFFILGDMCEFICRPFSVEPPIFRRRVAFFTKDRSFNTQKMREHAGFQCEFENERGLQELTDWYRNEGWL